MKLDNPLQSSLDNALPSFEETNNRPAIQPRAASNGTTHMPTEPPSNENQLPEADKGTLNDKLSQFKKERLLIDEQLGKQDADLASRLRTVHTFAFIEDICAIFRRLARDSKQDSQKITKEEKSVIAAVEKGEWTGELRFRNECFGIVNHFGIVNQVGKIPLFMRIESSVAFGLASQGRYSQFLRFQKQPSGNDLAISAVQTRHNIVHSLPGALDYAAVETFLRWFLSSLNAMLDCPERGATFLSSKRPGDIVKGVVKKITNEGIFVDLDGMNGFLSTTDIKGAGTSQPKEGGFQLWQKIEVIILDLNRDKECVSVGLEQKLRKVVEVFYEGVPIKGKVVAVVDGGLVVDIGVEAFVPRENMDIFPPNDLSPFVGNTYVFNVVTLNDERGKVVLTIEMERRERRNAFRKSTKQGDPVKLVVRGIVRSGVLQVDLVDLEGIECHLLISQNSKGCVENLHVDQEIEASVVKLDRLRGQIDISTKAATYSVLDEEAALREGIDQVFRRALQNYA